MNYNLTFTASKTLTTQELNRLQQKFLKLLNAPFGEWRPESPDHPTLTNPTLNKEVDPLLGYNKVWLSTLIREHILVQYATHEARFMNSAGLLDLSYSVARLDALLGHEAPGLDVIRDLIKRGGAK